MTTIVYKYDSGSQPADPGKRAQAGPSGHLMPFAPPPISAEQVVGRTVDEVCWYVGTYGMGGPGFFGLRLGAEWLVVAIWGAGDWMTAQARCVQDMAYEDYGRPRPWLVDDDTELSAHVVGQRVRSIDVQRHSLRIVLANAFDFTIEEAPDRRPLFEGNKQPRRFNDDDDLRRAVFLAPTAEVWV